MRVNKKNLLISALLVIIISLVVVIAILAIALV